MIEFTPLTVNDITKSDLVVCEAMRSGIVYAEHEVLADIKNNVFINVSVACANHEAKYIMNDIFNQTGE